MQQTCRQVERDARHGFLYQSKAIEVRMLAKAPDEIKVGDVMRALEKTTAITDCAERPDKLCGVCNRAGDCLSRWVWIEASKAMFERLDEITIGGLVGHKKEYIEEMQNYIDR